MVAMLLEIPVTTWNVILTFIGSAIVGLMITGIGIATSYFKKINGNLEKLLVNNAKQEVEINNLKERHESTKVWVTKVESRLDSHLQVQCAPVK